LSIEHGTYPYVTSSDCSLNGTASGVGLSARMVDLPLGIVKFPFMTRVGAGPFPTEFGGRISEAYCAEDGHTKLDELKQYGIAHQLIGGKVRYDMNDPKIIEMINSKDEFIQGIGIRLAAGEYGATTGRPRRTGWTDGVIAKYAAGINGPIFVLTKADSLSGAKEFKLAYGYEKGDQESDTFSKSEGFLRGVTPQYKSYEGYGDISQVRQYDKFPSSLREAIGDFEEFSGGRVVIVSVGADRDETVVR
jgi:adenylosuccinate synthase